MIFEIVIFRDKLDFNKIRDEILDLKKQELEVISIIVKLLETIEVEELESSDDRKLKNS